MKRIEIAAIIAGLMGLATIDAAQASTSIPGGVTAAECEALCQAVYKYFQQCEINCEQQHLLPPASSPPSPPPAKPTPAK